MTSFEHLLTDFTRLPRISASTISELEVMSLQMLVHLDTMLSHHPELITLSIPIGPIERRRTLQRQTDAFLELLRRGDPARLLAWMAHSIADQRGSGREQIHWRIPLECTLILIEQQLTPDAARELRPVLRWIMAHLDDLADTVPNGEAA